MKRIRITYQMSRVAGEASDVNKTYETAENCITTTMTDEAADELLDGKVSTMIRYWLDDLALFQGYDEADFVCAVISEL